MLVSFIAYWTACSPGCMHVHAYWVHVHTGCMHVHTGYMHILGACMYMHSFNNCACTMIIHIDYNVYALSLMQGLQSISGFRGLRSVGMLQISHNPDLISIDGLAGLQGISNMYVSNNPSLCYVLNSLSDMAYWEVSVVCGWL